MHSKKQSIYNSIQLCFSHIPQVYQICIHNSLYTRIFNFRHFCDFHILFVYQNTYTNHILVFYVYQFYNELRNSPFMFFAMVRYFLVDASKDLVIMMNQCTWKYANISSKRNLDVIYILVIDTKYIYLYRILLVACVLK